MPLDRDTDTGFVLDTDTEIVIDTDTEIVIRVFWGYRVWSWTFILLGIGLIAGVLTATAGLWEPESGPDTVADRIGLGLSLGGGGIFLFLLGLWLTSTTTKITFDQGRGHMTMRWRTWGRWPPFTRTKHISMEEVAWANISPVSGEDSQGRPRALYQVWLTMKSGEKVTLLHHPADRKVAERLQERILELRPAAVPR